MALASSSLRKRSAAGSQCSLRLKSMAMLPRWQAVDVRWPTSTAAKGSRRDLTLSRKLPTWSGNMVLGVLFRPRRVAHAEVDLVRADLGGRQRCGRAFDAAVAILDPALGSLETSAKTGLVRAADQFHAGGIAGAEGDLRGRIVQSSLRRPLGSHVFDLDRARGVCSQAPLSHIDGMSAEVGRLAARIVEVEAEPVEAAVLMIGNLGAGPSHMP